MLKELIAKLKSGETLTDEEIATLETADEEKSLADQIKELATAITSQKEVKEVVETKEVKKFADMTVDEKKAEFWKAIVTNDKSAFQNMGTDADGAVLVPTELLPELINKVDRLSVMRPEVRVIPNCPAKLDISFMASGASAYWVGEGVAKTTSKATFGKQTLTPYMVASIVVFSNQIKKSAAFDIAGAVEADMSAAIAETEDVAIIAGDGDSKPTGIEQYYAAHPATKKITKAATAALADRIIKAKIRLPEKYRNGAKFYMSEEQLDEINLLKDTTGQYLLHQNLDGSFTLAGKPVVTHGSFTNIWYGQLNAAYILGDGEGMSVKYTEDATITLADGSTFNCYQQNGFAIRVEKSVDGEMVNPNPLIAIEGSIDGSSS